MNWLDCKYRTFVIEFVQYTVHSLCVPKQPFSSLISITIFINNVCKKQLDNGPQSVKKQQIRHDQWKLEKKKKIRATSAEYQFHKQ